jgi:hypothetical protein
LGSFFDVAIKVLLEENSGEEYVLGEKDGDEEGSMTGEV